MSNELVKKQKSDENDIVQQLINETDPEKIKNITNLFNINSTKRATLRISALNDALDNLTEEVVSRSSACYGMDDGQLLDYYKTVSNSLVNQQKQINSVSDLPTVSINQNIVNIRTDYNEASEFDRDARERISEAIRAMLNSQKNENIVDVEVSEED